MGCELLSGSARLPTPLYALERADGFAEEAATCSALLLE